MQEMGDRVGLLGRGVGGCGYSWIINWGVKDRKQVGLLGRGITG